MSELLDNSSPTVTEPLTKVITVNNYHFYYFKVKVLVMMTDILSTVTLVGHHFL